MKNLLTGIMTKTSGSALSTDVAARIYFGQAPEGAVFPHIVISVSGTNEDTFTDRIDEFSVQFSLYSTDKGITEIGTMYADLRALFDDATFTITGNTLLRCQFQSFTTIDTDITTSAGTVGLRHWPVEYLMTMEAA